MKRLGIAAKLVLHSAWILIGLGAAVTLYSVSQLRGLLYQEMTRRVEAQTQNWIEANTSQIILSGDSQTLDRLVGELRRQEGIAYVVLLDIDGPQRAATGTPQGLAEERAALEGPDDRMRWREMKDAGGLRYFELAASISASGTGMSPDLGTLFGAAASSPTWGEVRVGVDRQTFDRSGNALVRRNVALAAVLIFLAIGLSFVFAKRMVTPITLMGRAADQIAAGHLSERVQQGDNLKDEVGDLVRNFNQMALRLEENREEMNLLYSGLEEKVRERTKELEQANRKLKELDQLKSDFLSTVSHELRTPLTSIKAYAEILLDSSHLEPEMERRFLGIVDKETDRMSRLISDLLNLAKIESGAASWTMTNFDLREVVSLSAAVLAPSAAEKGITLRVNVSEPQPVCADADRIQEVVTNLIGNGVKFCSRGGQIEVRLERATTSGPNGTLPGDFVRVAVIDNGPGIQPGDRERVFEKFYQGAKNHPSRSGSGLGLAISREIVLHHKGEIWLDSEFGVGSSFYFTLPLQLPRGAVQTRASESAGREA
jgi:signal transduction histidine kinase